MTALGVVVAAADGSPLGVVSVLVELQAVNSPTASKTDKTIEMYFFIRHYLFP
jgi:hypothetical protein